MMGIPEETEEPVDEYVASVLDETGVVTVRIRDSDDTRWGYALEPKLYVTGNTYQIFQLDKLCESLALFNTTVAREGEDRFSFRAHNRDTIQTLLKEVLPHVSERETSFKLLTEVVFPALEQRHHLRSKEGFVEVVRDVERVHAVDPVLDQITDRTAAFFEGEFGLLTNRDF